MGHMAQTEGVTAGTAWTGSAAEANGDLDLISRVDELIRRLLRASIRLMPDDLAPLLHSEATRCGFEDATIFLVDHEQRVLTPFRPVSGEPSALEIDTTVAGRAFQLERPFITTDGKEGSVNLWLPLLDSAERLGVLLLRGPVISEEVLARCEGLASLLSVLIVSQSSYGDSLVLTKRRQDMTLAAELRWSQLPPLTFTAQRVSIACVLEPPTRWRATPSTTP